MTGPQQPPYGGQGGQWPGGGGEWQSPSDQTQYGGAPSSGGPADFNQPQAYDQPGYGQPNYGQPQSYDQYVQPGYSDQFSAPPAGYGESYAVPPGYPAPMAPMPPVMPPAKQSNAAPWIVGGIAGVVVLVLVIIIGAVLMASGDKETGGGPGATGTQSPDAGGAVRYSGAKVSNACDLIDVKSVQRWASEQDREPDHSENKSDYYSSFSCSAAFKGGKYDSARISMYASVGGPDSNMKDTYQTTEKSAKGRTGSGRTTGDISGLGEDAYYHSYISDTDYSSSIIYELGMVDANLVVSIHVSVFIGKSGAIDDDDVRKICEDNARKVMEGLKA